MPVLLGVLAGGAIEKYRVMGGVSVPGVLLARDEVKGRDLPTGAREMTYLGRRIAVRGNRGGGRARPCVVQWGEGILRTPDGEKIDAQRTRTAGFEATTLSGPHQYARREKEPQKGRCSMWIEWCIEKGKQGPVGETKLFGTADPSEVLERAGVDPRVLLASGWGEGSALSREGKKNSTWIVWKKKNRGNAP